MNKVNILKLEKQVNKSLFFKTHSPKKVNVLLLAPLLGVVSIFITVLILLFVASSPSLLINHFVETLTDAFNYQAPSFKKRTAWLIYNKFDDNQSKSRYQIINQYRQISDNLVKNMRKEGIDAEIKNQRIISLTYKNQLIKKTDFLQKIETDINFADAIEKSFNGNRAMFQDDAWRKNVNLLQLATGGFKEINPKSNLNAVEQYRKQELELTKINSQGARFSIETTDQKNKLPDDLKKNFQYINHQADEINKSGDSPFYKGFDNLKLVESNFVNNRSACGLYQNNLFLKKYGKNEQAKQQAQLALNLFVESEKIKAGVATPEAIEFYGNRLTKTFTFTKPDGTKIETLSATDSQGYKYAAYGDSNPLRESARRFVLGANQQIASTLQQFKNQPVDDCSNQSSLGDFFSNVLSFLNPFRLFSKDLNQRLESGQSRELTESTIASMAHRKVSPELFGEDLGNAVTAGVSKFMGKGADIAGNLILTKQQAISYFKQRDIYLAQAAQLERQHKSPLDISSKHTFLGSIVYNNLNLLNSVSSLATFTTNFWKNSLASIAKLSTLSQISQAKSNQKSIEGFSQCYDPDLLALNTNGHDIAYDIFCNPIYGLPLEYSNSTPENLVNDLIRSGDLIPTDINCQENCQLQPAKTLANFQKNCGINRHNLAIGEENSELDSGLSCIANSTATINSSIFMIDQRIENILNKVILN